MPALSTFICPTTFTFIYKSVRHCSSSTAVRVRFAPSPTGLMHIGGLKTAFINYVFAKQHNGKFIVRMEDTDLARCSSEAYQDILQSLEWANINPDEGPLNGGPFGPYIQSQRTHLYKEAVQKLIQNGSAYYCFCSTNRLELLRKEQSRRNEHLVGYDGRCRHLSPQKVQQYLDNKDEFVIRFKLPENEKTAFHDAICGPKEFILARSECDPILIKRDGMPVYHLANVVDDHHMQITHVIRGMEWLPSTPKHILLYRAFGWKPPQFAHVPLLLNESGRKLSKRDAQSCSTSSLMRDIIQQGHFSGAILTWLMSSGCGFTERTWQPYLSMSAFLENFRLENIPNHSIHISLDLLHDCGIAFFNHAIDIALREDHNDALDNITFQANQFLINHGHCLKSPLTSSKLCLLYGRIGKLSDLLNYTFMWNPPELANTVREALHQVRGGLPVARDLLLRFARVLQSTRHCHLAHPHQHEPQGSLNAQVECHDHLKHHLLILHEELCTRAEAMHFLRIFLTGSQVGLPIVELVELLGVEKILSEIDKWLLHIDHK